VLLKRLLTHEVTVAKALATVDEAKRKVGVVAGLLRQLGDVDEHRDLQARFQAVRRRLERAPASKESVAMFGELTLAMHGLSLTLSEEFYPGD
jgi:hypothetical protein